VNNKKIKILVIGESCRDVFNYGYCERLCPEAPVPVFNLIRSAENGGMARNVYSNLLVMNADAFLYTNKNWKNITKTRFVEEKNNHMFMRLDIGDKDYGKVNLKKIKFSNYDAIIISDYNKGFLTEKDIEDISNKHPNTFLDTKKQLGNWCRKIKFIKINNFEYNRTKHLVDENIEEKLIITMGPEGCKYQNIIFPVEEVEIKDSSGAGDTFISAFALRYLETENVHEALKFASNSATKVVQKRGVSTV
jgi:D-glycero-beta-D-manno-heptose-7-phosphate kinase